jgi:hypothetical protein
MLLAEDDGHQFFSTVGVLGGAIAVSLVCIRASATARSELS